MRILSWNVQYGKSTGNVFDFSRTLDYINTLGEFDVICLQEIARYMDEYCALAQPDQLQLAQQYFNEHVPVWGPGFSWPSTSCNPLERCEFGNLSLINPELLDYKVHQLPRPAAPGKWQMQRIAIETEVTSSIGPLSIINTHLAFHDSNEAQQQLEHLTRLEQERLAQQQFPKSVGPGCYKQGFPASARVLCGDFNFDPGSSHYQYQTANGWSDAQTQSCPEQPHPPTCGIFDTEQWPQGEHCRDYFWLSNELASHKVDVHVDSKTNLSDHQPVVLEIDI